MGPDDFFSVANVCFASIGKVPLIGRWKFFSRLFEDREGMRSYHSDGRTSEDPKRRRFSDNSDDQKPCGNQRTQGGDKWVVKCDCGVLIGFYVKVILARIPHRLFMANVCSETFPFFVMICILYLPRVAGELIPFRRGDRECSPHDSCL